MAGETEGRVFSSGTVHVHQGDEVRVIAYEADTEMLSVVYTKSGQVWRLSLTKAHRVLSAPARVLTDNDH